MKKPFDYICGGAVFIATVSALGLTVMVLWATEHLQEVSESITDFFSRTWGSDDV